MNHRHWLSLMLFGLLVFLPSICHAQWYQGPSGGYGGKPFDHWSESKGATDISGVHILVQNSVIRCIRVYYRDSSGNFTVQTWSGGECRFEDEGFHQIESWSHIALDRDEYIIGIAGRYGARVDSIRFFTNRRNLPEDGGFYGDRGGTADYGYTAPSGQKIAAFIGRASDNLDAIGVLYVPHTPRRPQPSRLIAILPPTILLILLTGFVASLWRRLNKLDKAQPPASTEDLSKRIYQNFEFFIKIFLALVGAFGYVEFKYADSPQAQLGHNALLMLGAIGLITMTSIVISVASLQGWKLRRWATVNWSLLWTWQELYMMIAMYLLATGLWIASCVL